MQRLQSLEEGIELMEVEAAKLRNNTTERNKKKQRKRTVLSTASVLTTQAIQAIADAKSIAEEDKKQAKIAQDQAKIQRQAAATIAKEQLEARKEARTAATKLKKVANQHRREAGEAGKVAKKMQKAADTVSSIYNKKLTEDSLHALNRAVEEATSAQDTAKRL